MARFDAIGSRRFVSDTVIISVMCSILNDVGAQLKSSTPGYTHMKGEFSIHDRPMASAHPLGCTMRLTNALPISQSVSGVAKLDKMCGGASSKIHHIWQLAQRTGKLMVSSLWRISTTTRKGDRFLL